MPLPCSTKCRLFQSLPPTPARRRSAPAAVLPPPASAGRASRRSPTSGLRLGSSRSHLPQPVQAAALAAVDEAEGREVSSSSCYRFLADNGGVVKLVVRASKTGGYTVGVEVSFPPVESGGPSGDLVLNWRTDAPLQAAKGYTALKPGAAGEFATDLDFVDQGSPFYLSFVIGTATSEIRTRRRESFRVPVGLAAGRPTPPGVTLSADGMTANFALFSKSAERVTLCLYNNASGGGGRGDEPALQVELDPYINRTGAVWHVALKVGGVYTHYGYHCKRPPDLPDTSGHVLFDPYAKMLDRLPSAISVASLTKEPAFDWAGDEPPALPVENLVVYRANVWLYTSDKSSGLPANVAGTFAGLAHKAGHLQALGVNAVLLEPVTPFDKSKGPYFPYHWFSPANSYGTADCTSVAAINSMKAMVKSMHACGIEVLLEVAFTHTGECQGAMSFSGIDRSSYYAAGADADVLNCDAPVVQQLILDSLRHWVVDFHIDGFCFVDSSALVSRTRAPLLESVAFDPILGKTKLIADSWSPISQLCTDVKLPHWKRWAEMNTGFCTDVRNFLRGKAALSDLATRLCGGGHQFAGRGPAFTFNYVTRNSGLTLVDLVSYSSAELAAERSWNCGEEGPTDDRSVLDIRIRQIRNFLFILFVSLGVPVLNMGDECGYSTSGAPAYKDRQAMSWAGLRTKFAKEMTQFIAYLTSLRARRADAFQRKEFRDVESIVWHSASMSEPNWDDLSGDFLCMTIKAGADAEAGWQDLFLCFNAGGEPRIATLPELPDGGVWLRLVDTSLPFPGFFVDKVGPEILGAAGLSDYGVKAHSCALFEAS